MGKPVDGENLAASNATIPLKKKTFFSGKTLCYERFLNFGIAKIGIAPPHVSAEVTRDKQ